MRKALIITAICFIGKKMMAQNELYNNGAILQINTGCVVKVNGSFTNASGSTLTNNGTLTVCGNMTNSAAGSYNSGTLEFNGSSAQSLNGAADYSANHVLVNNAAGVTLNTRLKVDGTCTFTNGIITASSSSTPILFTATGTHTGASDASHVNGYVVKEGTGSFIYPVGNGSKYQKTDVNLSANGSGIQVKYNAADAGTAPFGTAGTEAAKLASYNADEYWDISPISAAAGTVTIYWDGYNDSNGDPLADRRVAHKTGGSWLNEGGSGTGTTSAGSVTSNNLVSWSPFALGRVALVLPVEWISASGHLDDQAHAQLAWEVQEVSVSHYEVEKSADGSRFAKIAKLPAQGDGRHTYAATDPTPLNGTGYYRIRQVDMDGKFSHSRLIALSNRAGSSIAVYPNPVSDVLHISGATEGATAFLTDLSGRVLRQVVLGDFTTTLEMAGLNSGLYLLKTSDGLVLKVVKE